jgi:hypothetical protein
MRITAASFVFSFASTAVGQLKVLVDQVGYERMASKQAIIVGVEQDHPQDFYLVDTVTNKTVFTGKLALFVWTPGASAYFGQLTFRNGRRVATTLSKPYRIKVK